MYRLTKAAYADAAFSGIGALHYPGRWHHAGTGIVYASDSPASALLETLVHTQARALLKQAYVLFKVKLDPERHLLVAEDDLLPIAWDALLWRPHVQRFGAQWFRDQDSVVLRVPSAVVPHHCNYLINPQHAQFGELQIEGPLPFKVDPRLA
ncbi:MAG: RES family NAD+ phosphorylase [Bacteroidota bacterium]